MAREHARILVSIWNDEDWKALRQAEQWLYEQLVSRSQINHAGVIALNLRKWAGGASDVTVADVDDALEGLADGDFVVVDEQTDEVLVRSFMRNDGVAKQPNILVSACRLAKQVESPAIRAALSRELQRIQETLSNEKAQKEVTAAIEVLGPGDPVPPRPDSEDSTDSAEEAKRNPSTEQRSTGKRRASKSKSHAQPEGFREDMSQDLREGMPEPQGVGEGVGEGGSVPLSSTSVRSRKRATRIPEDFKPTPELVAWAREKTPTVDTRFETEKFINYWTAKSGKDASKLDWPATWRNWMLNASQRTPHLRVAGGGFTEAWR